MAEQAGVEERALPRGEVVNGTPTTAEDWLRAVRCGPGPRPPKWQDIPAVREAHARLLAAEVEAVHQGRRAYPGGFEGDGIVQCVSAKPGFSSGKTLAQGYLPAAWVGVRELRRLGCTLPVCWYHLGPVEWDPWLTRLAEDTLGVRVYDLLDIDARSKRPWRILNGWESKAAAILASPFKRVLFLDADCHPMVNAAEAFGWREFEEAGAVLWPDCAPVIRDAWIPEAAWRTAGLSEPPAVACESGQLLLDKERCWGALQVTRHMNEHSDFWYAPGFLFGDKDTFWLPFLLLGQRAHMAARGPAGPPGGLTHFTPGGQRFCQHLTQNKPSLDGFPSPQFLWNQGEKLSALAELRGLWHGRLWQQPEETAADRALREAMTGTLWTYVRKVGQGERRAMRLLEDDRIGRGLARCECGWRVVSVQDRPLLVLSDVEGAPTALLRRDADGVWRGRWLRFEKCEVELVPEG